MKNKKGFTLLELLVAMAIIAVLIALAVFGIMQVQRNSRETQRIKALEDLNLGIQAFYNRCGEYPDTIDFANPVPIPGDTHSEVIEISSTSCVFTEEVTFKNSARVTDLNETNTNGALYAYSLESDGYMLGYCQENGDVYNAGTSIDKFPGDQVPLVCN